MRGVFDAAAQARVPVVLEHTDIAGMTAAVGFGLRATAVVAEPAAGRFGYRLRMLGDTGETALGSGETEHARRAHRGTRPEDATAQVLPAVTRHAETTADDVVRYVEDAGLRAATVALSSTTMPGTYAYYYLDFAPYSWSPGDGQIATADYDFEVEMYAASDPVPRKFMIVRPAGSGVNPGGQRWDDHEEHGWFQESLTVEITPQTDALTSYKHQPATDNRASTFAVTNGVSMTTGVSPTGPTAGITFNFAETATQSLSDFGVIDQSIGNLSKWSFQMTSADGNSYQDWDDLVDIWGFLFNPPQLAKSTLFPQFETVYIAPSDYRGRPTVRFQSTQMLRDTWVDWHLFWSDAHSKWSSLARSWDYSVDFARINAPASGTVPFFERMATASFWNNWQVVDEGTAGTATWTLGDPNWVAQLGDATNADGTRGSWLWAPGTFMGQGSLTGRVWSADFDTWGFMYSIQDAGNYYRAEVNARQGIARIVKVRDGVTTELASAPATPQVFDWQDWRIERSGSAHHLYLSGVKTVTGFDSELASGSIALYASAMSAVYFGRPLQIEYPGVRASELDLALGQATSQSSVAFDGASGRAVDGDTYASYGGRSVTHTNFEAGAWWRVDLGSPLAVDAVTVWNRTDCCADRLSNFYVELLDANGIVVKSSYYPGVAPASLTVSMGNAVGNFVRVRLGGTNYLSLAEVQVWPSPM
jgi:hypothetical protein